MPKRTAKDDEWGKWRHRISSLYREKTMEQVMNVMETQHGFHRKVHEYEAHLKKWRVVKNVREHEWDYIIPRFKERQLGTKDTKVRVHDVEIPLARVKKESSRRERQVTTFDRYVSAHQALQQMVQRARTPEGVEVRTPTPPSMSIIRHTSGNQLHISAESRVQERFGSQYYLSRNLPLHRLNRTFNIQMVLSMHPSLGNLTGSEARQLFSRPDVEHTLNQLANSLAMAHTRRLKAMDYLPSIELDEVVPSAASSGAIAVVNNYLAIFKTICGTISNSLHDWSSLENLVKLAEQDRQVQTILESLFRLRQPSTDAFAEKLFHPAILKKNIPLVKSLLKTGIDINVCRYTFEGSYLVTALFCAVLTQDGDLVQFMLDCKPTDWSAYTTRKRTWNTSIVTLAVDLGSEKIVRMLLQHESINHQLHPKTSPQVLCLAVLRGRTDLVDIILHTHPEFLLSFNETPGYLLEAAAVSDSYETFEHLLRLGIKPTQTHGCGSTLAVAILGSNKIIVEYLLAISTDDELNLGVISGPSNLDLVLEKDYGYLGTNFSSWRDGLLREKQLRASYRMTPTNAAIIRQDVDLLNTLLRKGADPNRPAPVFPLQLSAWLGDTRIAKILIDWGADPDATNEKVIYRLHGSLWPNGREDWKKDAFVNSGYTAFETALRCGNLPLVELLHNCGSRAARLSEPDVSLEFGRWGPLKKAMQEQTTRVFIIEETLHQVVSAPLNSGIRIDFWRDILQVYSERDFRYLFEIGVINEHSIRSRLVSCIMRYGVNLMSAITPQYFSIGMGPPRQTLLHAVIYHGNHEWIRHLHDCREHNTPDVIFGKDDGLGALIIAVLRKNVETIRLLLSYGVNPYQRLDIKWSNNSLDDWEVLFFQTMDLTSAFQVAYHQASQAIMDPLISDSHGKSVFESYVDPDSTSTSYYDIIQLFLKWKEPEKDTETEDKTAQLAAAYIIAIVSGYTRLEDLLTMHGVGIHKHKNWDQTLKVGLQYALRRSVKHPFEKPSPDIARILALEGQVDSPAFCTGPEITHWWNTSLQYATQLGNESLIIDLVNRGANVNAAPAKYRGATALQFAAMTGNFRILNLLFQAGSNINANRSPYEGRTALEGAAEWGRIDMAAHLLALGVNIEGKKNGIYRRSIFRAWENGHRALASMIQAWKSEKFGEEDCDEVQKIMDSMTHYELEHEPGHFDSCRYFCNCNIRQYYDDEGVAASGIKVDERALVGNMVESDNGPDNHSKTTAPVENETGNTLQKSFEEFVQFDGDENTFNIEQTLPEVTAASEHPQSADQVDFTGHETVLSEGLDAMLYDAEGQHEIFLQE